MGIRSKLQEDYNKIKGKSYREKLGYFRDYYLLPTAVIAGVLVLIVSIIVSVVTQKDNALAGVLLNASASRAEAVSDLEETVMEQLKVDASEKQVNFSISTYYPEDEAQLQTNYATVQLLTAQITGQLLDFIAGDDTAMLSLAYSDYFADLSKVLSTEQVEQYSEYFLYIDMAVVKQMQDAANAGNYDAQIKLPDADKPERMQQPVPVLLNVSSSEKLRSLYVSDSVTLLLGIAANCPNMENTVRFLEYILQD